MSSLQIADAQDSMPSSLISSLIEVEYQVLTAFFATTVWPVGVAIMAVWKTMNYEYVRFLDYGVLSGVCQLLLQSWSNVNIIRDRIASSTDLSKLSTLQRKRKNSSITKAFDLVSQLAALKHTSLSCFLVFVDDNGDHIRHVSHGQHFELHSIEPLCHEHITRPAIEQNHPVILQNHLENTLTPWKLSEQIDVLNCLPSLNTTTSYMTRKRVYNVHENRYRTSCKCLAIRGLLSDVKNVHAAYTNSSVYHPRKSCHINRLPADPSALTTKVDDHDYLDEDLDPNLDFDLVTKDSSCPWIQAPLKMSPVDKFRFLIKRNGVIRMTKSDVDCTIRIIWNKFDAVKGD